MKLTPYRKVETKVATHCGYVARYHALVALKVPRIPKDKTKK